MAKSADPIRSEKDLAKMLPSEPRLFPRIAEWELRRGSAKSAAKIVVKGLQQIPDSVSGWLVKGNLHLRLKQAKLARTAFEKALQIDPDIPFAHRQCADLAAEEGDQEGYLFHLRHLARLETLDENIQTMLQTALLREAAVKSGIYTRESVSRVMPGTLRQALLRAGALPEEIARRAERYEFPEDSSDDPFAEDGDLPREREVHGREKLAWEEPEAVEKIRRPEKETRDKYVRVSWADAVTDQSTQPLVEIGPEQFELSEEEEDTAQGNQTVTGSSSERVEAVSNGEGDSNRKEGVDSASMPKGDVSEPVFEHEPMVKPYVHILSKSVGTEPSSEITSSPKLEDEWVGATPQPPDLEPPKPKVAPPPVAEQSRFRVPPEMVLPERRPLDLDEETAPQPDVAPSTPPVVEQPRFRLPPDMVLPERRPLDLDEETASQPKGRAIPVAPPKHDSPKQTESDSESPLESSAPIKPTPPAARIRIPETVVAPPSMVERLSQTPGGGKFPRDDSSIMRLLGAERDKKPTPPRAPISQLLTRFETDDAPSNEPKVVKPIKKQEAQSPPPSSEPLEDVAPVPVTPVSVEEPEVKAAPPPPSVTQEKKVTVAAPQPELEPEPDAIEEAPLSKPADMVAREEEVRGKLAAIAKEVTGKEVAPSALKATPPQPTLQPPATSKTAETESKEGDAKGKAKIATKTLAELYASQGDWTRAVEVYEALLEKFPTNEAYKRRLDALRSKLTDN